MDSGHFLSADAPEPTYAALHRFFRGRGLGRGLLGTTKPGLFVRHARLAEPSEKRLLRQRLSLAVGLQRLKPCDADKATVAAEPPSLRELNRGARLVAL